MKGLERAGADLAASLVRTLASRGLTLATAESCTGGLVAELVTSIPGASEVLWGGVVAYSNECKSRLLSVTEATLRERGAVSREAAREMAAGLMAASGADIALAITGIAGPGGAAPGKPVGLVWIAWATSWGDRGEESAIHPGSRSEVRSRAASAALRRLIEIGTGHAGSVP